MSGDQSLESAFYSYQARCRGSLDAEDLRRELSKLSPWYRQRLGRFLPTNRDASILDAPCGHGNMLYFLREQGYTKVLGYDRDPGEIRLARLLELPAFDGDVFDILEQGRTYDCILTVDFLEHLPRDKAYHFLKLCHERLNQGGSIILRTPCADGFFGAHDRYNDVTHQWAVSSNVLSTLLQMVGFQRVAILDERPQPHNLTNTVRLLVYYPAKWLTSAWLTALGMDLPRVWSRSMWAVGMKGCS